MGTASIEVTFAPLVASPESTFARGTVFRIADAREGAVDLLLVEHEASPSGYALLTVTGYKAGLVRVHLPPEARARAEDAPGIAAAWLAREWTQWVDETGPSAALVASGYRVVPWEAP